MVAVAAKLPEYGLDAMLITSGPNRLYANGFASTAGTTLVTGDASYFFVDSRYIEAAGKRISGAEVLLANQHSPYAMVEEMAVKHGVKRMGFEEANLTVGEFNAWSENLSCELVPATKLLARRQV